MYNLQPLLQIKQSQNECTNFSDWRKQGKGDFEIRLQYLLQGLGLAIVRALLVTGDPDTVVLLGSRDLKRGEAAVKALQAEIGCSGRLFPLQLDVTSQVDNNGAL